MYEGIHADNIMCVLNFPPTAEKILKQGVEPNISNADGLTPLHKVSISIILHKYYLYMLSQTRLDNLLKEVSSFDIDLILCTSLCS